MTTETTMPEDDIRVIATLAEIPLDKVGGIVWLAERHLRETEGPSLPEVVRTSRAHGDHLIEELRAIGNWTEHTPGAPEEHIHEPSTGGVGPCGPCRAWRVLNGSTGALR